MILNRVEIKVIIKALELKQAGKIGQEFKDYQSIIDKFKKSEDFLQSDCNNIKK